MTKCSYIPMAEAVTGTTTRNISFSLVSFNCSVMKSSFGMILDTMKHRECVFLCETWLRLNRLHTIMIDLNEINYYS